MASLACSCNGASIVSANLVMGSSLKHKVTGPAASSSCTFAFFKASPLSLSSSPTPSRYLCRPVHVRAEEGIVEEVQDAADKVSGQVKKATQQAQDFLTGASKDAQSGAERAASDVRGRVDEASNKASHAGKDLQRNAQSRGSNLSSEAESLKDKVSASAQDAGDALKSNVDKAKDSASDVASSVKGSVENLGRDAQKAVDDAKSRIQQ